MLLDNAKTNRDFYDSLSAATDEKALEQIVSDCFSHPSIIGAFYLYLPVQCIYDSNILTLWGQKTARSQAIIDIITYIVKTDFDMQDIFSHLDKMKKPTSLAKITYGQYFKEKMAEHGIHDNDEEEISFFPVYGGRGGRGLFRVSFTDDVGPHVNKRALHAICQAIHQRRNELWQPPAHLFVSLNKREKQILNLIAIGKSNSVIAQILGISPHTVDAYLRRAYLKLDVNDRTRAALKASHLSLLTLGPDLSSVKARAS